MRKEIEQALSLFFTNTWNDRLFVGVMIMIAIGLLWLKYLVNINIWFAFFVSMIILFALMKPAVRKKRNLSQID